MSLLPYFFDDFAFRRPRRLPDQHFGLAITPDDLLTAVVSPSLSPDYFRPWRQLAAATRDVGSSIKVDKDKFEINLDVQHFAPEEISVKTADGYIVVEGQHEERRDAHGFISRRFSRRYALPAGASDVESRLSSDGVLTVTARTQASGERTVPIARTGPVRKEISHAPVETADNDNKKEEKE